MQNFTNKHTKNKVQFSSVAQSRPTLCDPMNRSTPGLPVHHQLPESTQTQGSQNQTLTDDERNADYPKEMNLALFCIWEDARVWAL